MPFMTQSKQRCSGQAEAKTNSLKGGSELSLEDGTQGIALAPVEVHLTCHCWGIWNIWFPFHFPIPYWTSLFQISLNQTGLNWRSGCPTCENSQVCDVNRSYLNTCLSVTMRPVVWHRCKCAKVSAVTHDLLPCVDDGSPKFWSSHTDWQSCEWFRKHQKPESPEKSFTQASESKAGLPALPQSQFQRWRLWMNPERSVSFLS